MVYYENSLRRQDEEDIRNDAKDILQIWEEMKKKISGNYPTTNSLPGP